MATLFDVKEENVMSGIIFLMSIASSLKIKHTFLDKVIEVLQPLSQQNN